MVWYKKEIILVALLIMISGSAYSQESQDKNNRSDLDSKVRHGQLDNGFTYYLRKNDIPKNKIEVHLVVKAGIYHQDDTQVEYAHLLEHLGFKGTKHFPHAPSHFGKPGMFIHANTAYDHTGYFVRIPADDPAAFQDGLQLLHDLTQNILLERPSIDVERSAVLGEMRTNNPYKRWLKAEIEKNILSNTGFNFEDREKAKRNIENFNDEAFFDFYKDWYRPDLQAIIVIGDINVDSVEVEIQRKFSDLEIQKKPKNAEKYVDIQKINLQGHNRYLTVIDSIDPSPRLNIMAKRPNAAYNPKTRADFKNLILQRLYQHLVEEKSERFEDSFNSLFSDFSSQYANDELAGGQLQVTSMKVKFNSENDLKQKNKKLRNALIAWKRIHKGITDSELQQAKEQLIQEYSNSTFSSSALAYRYRDHFIKKRYARDPKEEMTMIAGILRDIDLEEIQSFIAKAGDLNKNVDFMFMKGANQKVPDYKDIKKWINEVEKMEVEPIELPEEGIKTLTNTIRIPVNDTIGIEEMSKNIIDVSTMYLKNGIKLVLKPLQPANQNYRGNIQIDAYRNNNISVKNRKEYLQASLVPEVLRYTGAGPYSIFELEKFKKARGIRLKFDFNKDIQTISGKTPISEIEEFLSLLYLYSTKPRIDPDGFRLWKKNKKMELNGKATRGSSAFYLDEITALHYPELPRLNIEELEEISLKRIIKTHQKWFSDFKDYTFIITGDFDPEQLVPKLIRILSGYPNRNLPETNASKRHIFPLRRMEETIYLKNINQTYVHLAFPIKIQVNTKNIVLLRLLETALNEKIYARLRDGCFAPRAFGRWEDFSQGIYSFNVSFDSALDNQEKMIEMALETFQNLREEGVEEAWLENVIKKEALTYGKTIDSFGFFNMWPDYLQRRLRNKKNLETEVAEYKTILEHFISIKDMNMVTKEFLSDKYLQEFVILPQPGNDVSNVK
ncbi:MAG: insulinase family protein [Salegentibacter mishustinae]|nr:insulinase family protein [Salegentibacter mishustinae]